MNRRTFLCGLTLGTVAAPLAVAAQQSSSPVQVGFLSGYSAAGAAAVRSILVDALRDLGYREGSNLLIVDRYADGWSGFPTWRENWSSFRSDVITTQTTPAALAAKQATPTIPIVNVTSGDAVGSGIVVSLARPGGNVTGLSFLGTELAVKQMQLLKEVAPTVKHIALLGNPGIPPERGFFREMERNGPGMGIRVRFVEAKTSSGYEAAFAAIAQHYVDGLIVAPSIANHDEWPQIVTQATSRRLPILYPFREFVEAGGLASYGFNRREFWGRAAVYVDKILKGAKPANLPVEQPTKFELVINLKTAKTLGLTVPQTLLLRADQVIQ